MIDRHECCWVCVAQRMSRHMVSIGSRLFCAGDTRDCLGDSLWRTDGVLPWHGAFTMWLVCAL